MAEVDAMSNFDFNKVTGSGLFVKFRADVPLTVRILTLDPIISEKEFVNKQTGEVNNSVKFAYVCWNWTEEKAQILQLSPNLARRVAEIHKDPEFGNIRDLDVRITPTGEGLERRYELQVIPKSRTLTAAIVNMCRMIDLDKSVTDSKGRMSTYDPDNRIGVNPQPAAENTQGTSGYEKAKQTAAGLNKTPAAKPAEEEIDDTPPTNPDPVFDVQDDEEINLDDIPF